MSTVFFTADPHFGHTNIIRYENRPFASAEEMDQELIRRWNETVSPEDTVYLLGDFSFYGKENPLRSSPLSRDISVWSWATTTPAAPNGTATAAFEEVYDCPILFESFWLLSHEPLYLNSNMPYGNLFGHVHGNPAYADASSQSCCVCVERTDYRPISFEEVKRRMGLIL